MATPEEEPTSESLKYKTWVLKVSIHCEACKRKVQKILYKVDGVYKVDIDAKQQRVVVTGNVEGEALIKKLTKSNKHAEFWPEKTDQKEKKSANSKNKEKQNNPESSEQAGHGGGSGCKEIKPPVKVEAPQVSNKSSQGSGGGGGRSPAKSSDSTDGGGGSRGSPAKSSKGSSGDGGGSPAKSNKGSDGGGGGNPAKSSEGSDGGGGAKVSEGAVKNTGGGQVVTESKSEGKKPVTGSAVNQSPPHAEKKDGESDAEKTGGDGGNAGKKKKKKGQNGNNVEGEPSSAGPASIVSPNHTAGPPPVLYPANYIPPRQHGYHYPPTPHYYAPPPENGVSYNTVHPTSTHTASYYASPPPYSHAYTYPGPEAEATPSDFDSYPRQPLDSFEMFSDENPNGCSIM